MISVIIGSYNGEKYILAQLNSIRRQSVPVDEVIICDDRSQDTTGEIVNKYIVEHHLAGWQYSVNEKNLGPAANAYHCLTKTRGEIIFLADQDNIWEENYVAEMTEVMQQDSDILLVTALCSYIDQYDAPITDAKLLKKVGVRQKSGSEKVGELPFVSWVGSAYAAWCMTCIRGEVREALMQGGIPPLNLSIGIDGYTGLMAAVLGRTCRLNLPLVRFRVHDANYSLGRLKKNSILNSSNSNRLLMLEQAKEAHRFLLLDNKIATNISSEKKQMLEAIIKLFEKRIAFCTTPNIFRWLALLGHMKEYYWHANNKKKAMKMWLTDFMYAYNINWHLKPRAK